MSKIKTQLREMGLYENDYRMFPVDTDHLGKPVFRVTRLAMRNKMIFTQNDNPTAWLAIPLSHATEFRNALIGYCFQDGELRWDAEFILHHGLEQRTEVELPVHLVMYAPQYPLHLRNHLAYEKHVRSADRKRLAVQKASPPSL
jgi:hypothetical protein